MSIINRRLAPSTRRRPPGSDASYGGPYRRHNGLTSDRRQKPYAPYDPNDPPQAEAAKWGTEFSVTKEEHTRQIIDPPPPAPRYCIDCRHMTNFDTDEAPMCQRILPVTTVDAVAGEVTRYRTRNYNCGYERGTSVQADPPETRCGPDAKYWEPRP